MGRNSQLLKQWRRREFFEGVPVPQGNSAAGRREPSNNVSQVPEEGSEAHVGVPTLSVFSGKDCLLAGQINGVPASILVDTGVAITVFSKCMWDHAKEEGAQLNGISR